MANEQEKNLNELEGERGVPSVNRARSSGTRVVATAFVLAALTLVGLVFWLQSGGKSSDEGTGFKPIETNNTKKAPTKTFELEPLEEDVVEPIKVQPAQEVVIKNNVVDVVQKASLNKSTSSMMVSDSSSSRSNGQTTNDTAQTVSEMIKTMNEANDVGVAPEGGKSLLSSLLTNNNEDKSNASFLGNRNLLIAQGTFIDCVLRTKLISTVAGMSSCVISKNIYSDNGKVVLVERGSEVIGQYQTTLQQGQKRIFVLWNRIKTPNGVVIDLASPGTDSLGASGLPGWVDTHFWERFGSALLFSVVDDLAQAAVNQSNNSNNQTINFGNTAETSGEVATEIIKSTIDIKPTLYKNQGERINIFVARDLDFSGVYDVSAK